MRSSQSEDDQAEQILYWQQKLDELKSGYEKMFFRKNPVYAQQLDELTNVHDKRVAALEKWRSDKIATIQNEKEKKIALLQSECDRHRKGIPKLLQKSIQQQFDQLSREFSGVFEYFMQEDIPFVQEFARHNFSKVFTVDCSRPLLDSGQIKRDLDKIARSKPAITVRGGEIVTGGAIFRVGNDVVLKFGRLKPIPVTISEVQPDALEFMPKTGSKPIRIGIQSFEARVVAISHD
jgi:hypothetical protein